LKIQLFIVAVIATRARYAVDNSEQMEVSTMGRKTDSDRLAEVIQTIQTRDGKCRANDVAKELGLHPQAVARLLSAAETARDSLLCEDDRGFLSIFKKWW
jgi:predicted transcriptional regulator